MCCAAWECPPTGKPVWCQKWLWRNLGNRKQLSKMEQTNQATRRRGLKPLPCHPAMPVLNCARSGALRAQHLDLPCHSNGLCPQQRCEVIGGHGPTAQVSLVRITAPLSQEGQLAVGLHPLGQHRQPHAVPPGDDGGADGHV